MIRRPDFNNFKVQRKKNLYQGGKYLTNTFKKCN